MAARKPAPKPEEKTVECEHIDVVWNNGMTICADCGTHLS
jgi:hypothetical protein